MQFIHERSCSVERGKIWGSVRVKDFWWRIAIRFHWRELSLLRTSWCQWSYSRDEFSIWLFSLPEIVWHHANTGMLQKIDCLGKSSFLGDIWILHSAQYFHNKACSQIKCSLWRFRFPFQPEFLAMVSEKHKVWVEFSAKLSWLGKKLKSSKNKQQKTELQLW